MANTTRNKTFKRWSAVALAAALGVTMAGMGMSAAQAAPVAYPRLTVDLPDQAGTATVPGTATTLTTKMTTTAVGKMTDIVFVLDTTGSMGTTYTYLEQGLSDFVTNLAAAGGSDLAFGVVAFGDVDSWEGGGDPEWVLPLTPLSSTFAASDVADTFSVLPFKYSGSVTLPEDPVLSGVWAANGAGWREGSQRELVLISDQNSLIRDCATYPDFCIDGRDPDLTTFQSVATDKGINVTVVNARSYRLDPTEDNEIAIEDVASFFGSDPEPRLTTDQEYLDHLTAEVIPVGTEIQPITVVPTLTVTYDSDGADASADAVVTMTPSSPTSVGTTEQAFSLSASPVDPLTAVRYGDSITVTATFTVQGTDTVVAQQVIKLDPPAPTEMNTTRTIHYQGAGAATPADVVQTITWDIATDSGTLVFTARTADYAAVATPAIAGHTVDVAEVAAVAVVSPTATMPTSSVVQVTYTPVPVAPTGGSVAGDASPALAGLALCGALIAGAIARRVLA